MVTTSHSISTYHHSQESLSTTNRRLTITNINQPSIMSRTKARGLLLQRMRTSSTSQRIRVCLTRRTPLVLSTCLAAEEVVAVVVEPSSLNSTNNSSTTCHKGCPVDGDY